MAVDIFLKLNGIDGESKDSKHPKEIELLSWSWGVSQTGSVDFGSGAGSGKASFQDLQVSHPMDAASPNLALFCASGEHIKSAVLTQRKAGKDQQDFLIFKMSDVLITHVASSASDGSGQPHEQVGLTYAKIEMEYKPQKEDGSLAAGIKWGWDRKLNKKV